MMCVSVIIISVLIIGSWASDQSKFPPSFKFGAATSAYQIEGAWNVSDKGETVWDRLIHTHPELIAGGGDADIACDSYHQWRRDIQMLEEIGMDMYRFSISWARVLPTGLANYVSEDGTKYYSNLIDGLLDKNIEPVVTIFHLDLPQAIQELGGWANPMIVDWFADYARVVFTLYGDRVKTWLTMNEPIGLCDHAYTKQFAPYLDDEKVGQYLCNKNVLLAHAKAWRIYDEEFKPIYHGKVSIVNVFIWFEAATPEDEELTELTRHQWEGRYSYPIYSKEGGWPPVLEEIMARNSRREGYRYPRLPPFTEEEKKLVRGTYDFYALNHYSTRQVRKARPGEKIGSWPFFGSEDLGVIMEANPSWAPSDVGWFSFYPEGLRHQLHWMNRTYGPMDILITENGFSTMDATVNDDDRVEYLRGYLEQLLLAINDGISVIGYTTWSLMDTFEWLGGYKYRFGLYAVDFSDPLRTRTPRDSARYYASVARTRSIDPADRMKYMYYE